MAVIATETLHSEKDYEVRARIDDNGTMVLVEVNGQHIDEVTVARGPRRVGASRQHGDRSGNAAGKGETMNRDHDWLRRIVDETAFEVQAKQRHLLSREVQDLLAKHGPIGGTRKIADLPKSCAHPEHNPPSHMVYDPGLWQHTCPSCGGSQTFTVTGVTL